jgi:hypothetical protein
MSNLLSRVTAGFVASDSHSAKWDTFKKAREQQK